MASGKIHKEEVNVQKLYGKESTLTKDEFIKEYNIDIKGLSSSEAEKRLQKYGLNEIKSAKPKKWYNYFLESLFSPFNSILLRNSCYPILYRCIFRRSSKLCKYISYFYFGYSKYIARVF